MNLSFLKKIRVWVSLLIFLTVTAIFLDFSGVFPPGFINAALYPQFVPSVLKFLGVVGLAAAGFAFIIVLTALFGRVYCSSICPLGTLQDIITHFSHRKRKNKQGKKRKARRKYKYLKPLNIVRYGILAAVVGVYLLGSVLLVNLLDPFSAFGKIATSIFRPFYTGANNLLVAIFENFDIYYFYPVEVHVKVSTLVFSLLLLAFVGWLAYTRGRQYCNTVCPVGALLGLVSKVSLFKISIDTPQCTACGLCENVCKAGCIDTENQNVDFSRCVACFNCITACPHNGVTYRMAFRKKEKQIVETKPLATTSKNTDNTSLSPVYSAGGTGAPANPSRRKFLLSSLAYTLGFSSLVMAQDTEIIVTKPSTVPVVRKNPVTPPGSLGIQNFMNKCTACQLCVSECPTQVLQPSFLEYGWQGIMQPTFDYTAHFCNYECTICADVCPSGAILPLTVEEKKTVQMGKVVFVKENCVVYTENTDCGACSEHCPTKAVKMVPYNDIYIPEVEENICVGCGACEYICPVKPYKAIYVEGNPIHLVAEVPEQGEIQENTDFEEFPF